LQGIFVHITNFYLYSSLHIGLCSIYLYLFTVSRFGLQIDWRYLFFTASSTIFVYSIHRLIGIRKVKEFAHKGRFAIIEQFRNHIFLYSILSFGVCCYLYLNFDISRTLLISGAGIISILYTVPVFGKSKRLRDFSFVKIFLIAIVWSFVCGTIPMYEQGMKLPSIITYFLELVFFFIAITIPFDIRDYYVDGANKVDTIPTLIGRRLAVNLSYILLGMTVTMDILLIFLFNHQYLGLIVMIFTSLLTGLIIKKVWNKESDYYFSGLLETTIMFPYAIDTLFKIFLG